MCAGSLLAAAWWGLGPGYVGGWGALGSQAQCSVCSGVPSCQETCCCTPLGHLHCDCCVTLLKLSPSQQWSSCGSHALGGLWMTGALVSSMPASGPVGWGYGSPHPLLEITWRNLMNMSAYAHMCTHRYRHRLPWGAAAPKNILYYYCCVISSNIVIVIYAHVGCCCGFSAGFESKSV